MPNLNAVLQVIRRAGQIIRRAGQVGTAITGIIEGIRSVAGLVEDVQQTAKEWLKIHIQNKIKTKLYDIIKESILYILIYSLLLGISFYSVTYSIKLLVAIFIIFLYVWLFYKFFFRTIPDFKKKYKQYKTKSNRTILTLLQLSIWEIVIEKSIISLIGITLILGITRLVLGKYEVLDPIFNLF